MDRRIRKTQTHIKNAFVELLKNNHLNKITVTDICALADINRSTFYEHYLDVYDLYDKMEVEISHNILDCLLKLNTQTVQEALECMLDEVDRQSDVYIIFMRNSIESLKHTDKKILQQHGFLKKIESDYDAEYILSGVLAIITKWIENGKKETTAEMASIIYRLTAK